MAAPPRTPEELRALFAAKTAEPPPEANLLLVSHLTCKESLQLANSITGALHRYAANGSRRLSAPTELLPPLG
jgi:hypothetical protein